tara:strand:+ start:19895 stop:20278 length:384 start_codon:yes stop_codon:yes gene_type:complete
MNTLKVTDESAAGHILHEISLQFESEYITVLELIEARINSEIQRYEQDVNNYQKGLVLPHDMEKRLNRKKVIKLDREKQLYVALEAFRNNGFFILVDDEQVDSLEQRFLVDESTHVSFIKLTPMVGG